MLILGGTTEANALVSALGAHSGWRPVLSLAGVTRSPRLPAAEVRIGGFGGADGLEGWLREHGMRAVVDATHPFAVRISANARESCRRLALPMLRIERPAWQPIAGDDWHDASDMMAAAALLGDRPRRVLLTVGRKDLLPFRRRGLHRYLVRSVDPPPPELLPEGAAVLAARGPFTLDGERQLLRAEGIEWLVTKNAGGIAVSAKLQAARELGIPVAMVRRPDPPSAGACDLPAVPDWRDALSWLANLSGE
ncbi:cobalt-precorrin-6A reductase [Acetobacteraceae bacterium KSS12]|uniref:Cobalt-precorrin-6A reductase n=1 Tax=Rhizosaccharibacter radicis TaxID=2782605 RepID=A0ABT1VZI2_9PROT|nr:cobalt-precorrin-6A reductase [Acetobacteraceae bacterium KSS12]